MMTQGARHHRACLLPRTLTSSAYGEGAKSGRKAVRKRKAKTWETERWHSLHSLKQWVYFYLCHKGQRAHVVISNTASSWPRRDYVRQHWNHNVSHGNGAGGLLIALGIQRYHSHPACSNCLGEREIVNSPGEKKTLSFQKYEYSNLWNNDLIVIWFVRVIKELSFTISEVRIIHIFFKVLIETGSKRDKEKCVRPLSWGHRKHILKITLAALYTFHVSLYP